MDRCGWDVSVKDERYQKILKSLTSNPSDPSYWAKRVTNLLLDLRAIEHGADVSIESIKGFIMHEGLHEDADFSQFEGMFDKVFSVYIVSRIADLLNMDSVTSSEIIRAEISKKFGGKDPSKQDFLAKVVSMNKPDNQPENQ